MKKSQSSKFGIGCKVCLRLSNPGFSGVVAGILHPAALNIFHKKEEIDGCIEHWVRISKSTKEDIFKKPIYLIIFDTPKTIPLKDSANKIIGKGDRKFASVFTFEDDVISYEDFWKAAEKQTKKMK